jgi:hypothetical protein
MTIADTVRCVPESAHHLDRIARNVAASLPATSFANADRSIAFVDGEGAWDENVLKAAAAGAAGILLDRPGYLPAPRVELLAAKLTEMNVALVVRSVWSSHAMIASARQFFQDVEQPVLIDVVLRNDGTIAHPTAMIGAIQMIQALIGDVNQLIVDSADPTGIAARGTVGDGKLPLTLAAGPSCSGSSIEIRLLGIDRMASLSAPYSTFWGPLRAVIADANGERAVPAHFESPDRTAYVRLIDLIGGSLANLDDLHRYRETAALIESTSLV